MKLFKKLKIKSLFLPRFSRGGRNKHGLQIFRKNTGYFRKICLLRFPEINNIAGFVLLTFFDFNLMVRKALILLENGFLNYILITDEIKVGEYLKFSNTCFLNFGNSTTLSRLPHGTFVFNLNSFKSSIIKSSGCYGIVLGKIKHNFTIVKLCSGEEKIYISSARGMLGLGSNRDKKLLALRTAGIKRIKGFRPHVRGVAKNPVDHPMGGGEGKSSGGRTPCNSKGQILSRVRTARKLPLFIYHSFFYKSRRGKFFSKMF